MFLLPAARSGPRPGPGPWSQSSAQAHMMARAPPSLKSGNWQLGRHPSRPRRTRRGRHCATVGHRRTGKHIDGIAEGVGGRIPAVGSETLRGTGTCLQILLHTRTLQEHVAAKQSANRELRALTGRQIFFMSTPPPPGHQTITHVGLAYGSQDQVKRGRPRPGPFAANGNGSGNRRLPP